MVLPKRPEVPRYPLSVWRRRVVRHEAADLEVEVLRCLEVESAAELELHAEPRELVVVVQQRVRDDESRRRMALCDADEGGEVAASESFSARASARSCFG